MVYTERLKRILREAERQAAEMNDNAVNAHHVMLAILDNGGVSTTVIRNLGLTPERIREETFHVLDLPFH